MPSPSPPEKRVDRWEIRCRFNQARYQQRAESGEFVIETKKKVIRPGSGLPLGYKFSVEWYYINPHDGNQMAQGHYYERDDESTTQHDPKHLYLNGVKYSLHRGTGWKADIRRDPSLLFSQGSIMRAIYVHWRRFKCHAWGK
jgi:hypothetical protein